MASGKIAAPSYGKALSVDTVSLEITSVAANSVSQSDNTIDASKTGYTPLGIVGYSIVSSGLVAFRLYMVSGGEIRGRFRNMTSSAVSSRATIYVLYEEN